MDNWRHENGIAAAAEIFNVVFDGLNLTMRLNKQIRDAFLNSICGGHDCNFETLPPIPAFIKRTSLSCSMLSSVLSLFME
ncbi:hypothetical protein F2Q69_00045050 [Brassica cretica]|uniref:Uncharacterized protein n=1 Tax=Brassica cretica TaxID=69181 RepID=A0A8S9NGD4_BRACR|nr:hypothetical protein F2Q69_00045050 [Brassica cretica]